jgi:putative membrane protein
LGRPLFAESAFRGVGFGLGVSVVVDAAAGKVLTHEAEYAWGGLASTFFAVDPVAETTCCSSPSSCPRARTPSGRSCVRWSTSSGGLIPVSNALALTIRVVVVAISLWVATLIVPGIDNTAGSSSARVGTLIAVAIIFGVVNAVLKPLIKVVGCPFYILTLGLIALVVNALLFLLVGALASGIGLPFSVGGFGAAFFGAIVVGVVGFILHILIPDRWDQR